MKGVCFRKEYYVFIYLFDYSFICSLIFLSIIHLLFRNILFWYIIIILVT